MDMLFLAAIIVIPLAVIGVFWRTARSLADPRGRRRRGVVAKPGRIRHINPKTGAPFP